MRIVANSIPKSGTHLLDRLLVLLGFELVDLGGLRPHLARSNYRFPVINKRLKGILGLRGPEDVMGIGPHLVEGGRFRPARRFLRGRGEKVTVGVVSPQHISRRWLTGRLSKVPEGGFVNAHCIYTPELADLFRQEGMKTVCILRDPRDVAVSQMHYIKQLENHFAHEGYMALPSDSERLLLSIRGGELGGRKLQSLDERYRQFLRWERDGGAVVAKFEDLVGTKGGGKRGGPAAGGGAGGQAPWGGGGRSNDGSGRGGPLRGGADVQEGADRGLAGGVFGRARAGGRGGFGPAVGGVGLRGWYQLIVSGESLERRKRVSHAARAGCV